MGIILNVELTNMEGYNLRSSDLDEHGKPVTDEDGAPALHNMTTRDLMRSLATQLPRDFTTHNDDEFFIVLNEAMIADPTADGWDIPDRHWTQLFGDEDEKKGILNRQIPNPLYVEKTEGSNKVTPFMRAIFGINTTTIVNQIKGNRDLLEVGDKPKTPAEIEAERKSSAESVDPNDDNPEESQP